MFFSDDFLLKRKGGMGIIWLSATLGTRKSSNATSLLTAAGVTKKQILAIDVSKACESIIEPAEPLALRASAGLLVGVVRIFNARYEIFVNDVTVLEAAVRRAMLDLNTSRVGNGPLELAGGGVAGKEAITLPGRHDDLTLGDGQLNQAEDWHDFLKKFSAIGGEDPLESLASGHESTLLESSQNATGSQASAASKIGSLPGHRRRASSLGRYNDLLAVGDYRDDAPLEPEPDFGVGADGIDLGLDDGGGDMNMQRKGRASDAAGGQDGDLALQLDDGGFDLPLDDGFGFDFPQQQRSRAGSISVDDLVRRDIQAGKDQMMSRLGRDLTPLEERQLNRLPALPGQDNENQDEAASSLRSALKRPLSEMQEGEGEQADEGQTRPKKKKKKVSLFDAVVTLGEDELRAFRKDYIPNMSKAQQEMQKKEDLKDAQKQLEAKFALGLPVDLPDYALNPDLAAFFKQAVVNKFAGVKPAQQVVEEEDVEQLRHADENLDLDFGGGFDDIGQQIGDFDFADIEFGRKGDAGQKDDMMPWELYEPGRSETGKGRLSAGPSSLTGSAAKFSLGTPQQADLQMRRRARSSSILGSHKSGSVQLLGADQIDDGALELPDVGDVQLELEAETPVQSQSQGDEKAQGFLNFVKHKAAELGGDDPFQTQEVDFDDVAPVGEVKRRAAAAAFYHCLHLATRDLLKLSQEIACGPITIAIK